MRVIKNGRIAVIRRDDQRIASRGLLQFQSEISHSGRSGAVKSLDAEVRGNRKRRQEQNCAEPEKRSGNLQPCSNPFARAAGKDRCDRDQRKLIPLMAVPIPDKENEQHHGREPPMKESRVLSTWQNERAHNRERAKSQ